MNKHLPLGKPITLEKLLASDARDAPTSTALQARYLDEIKSVEKELGPHVPALAKGVLACMTQWLALVHGGSL